MGEGTGADHDLLIRLEEKIDNILCNLKDIPVIDERVRNLEITSKSHTDAIETIQQEVNKLRTSNTLWSSFNTILIGIASFLGLSR